mgnify:CR=1 FL=1
MKKILLLVPITLLFACGGEKEEGWATDDLLVQPSEFPAGEKVYMTSCVSCHQKNGEGLEGVFPPLANSDYLLADKKRAIDIAANGLNGEIVVNGVTYDALMAPQGLSNEEVKDVVNYVLNSWGNDGGEVTMKEVEEVLGK